MPQIKEYTAEATSLRPTETGIDALSQVGRRAGGFYNQAAEAMKGGAEAQARAAGAVATADENVARSVAGIAKSVDEAAKQADAQITHQEVSHGMASFAQLHSDLTDSWNDTAKNADPNDTSIAGKFRETQLEPALDQFTGSFHTTAGQQWAENHAMALRDHMFEKQSADMATLAGDAVAVNVRKTTNAWSNTARNDPSSVPFLLQTADASIAGIVSSSPNLKGTEAAKVHSQVTQKAKEEIVKAGALGAIEKSGDPEAAAAAFAKRYPEYVNAQEIDQLGKAAKAYQRAASADSERARRLAKEQADDKSEGQRDKYIQDIFGDNSQATMKQVLGDQSLTAKDREHLVGVIQREGKTTLSDKATNTDLQRRLVDPDKPTTLDEVLKAHASDQLNDSDFRKRYEDVKLARSAVFDDPIFKMTIRNTEKAIGNDPKGEELQAQFAQKFMRQYEAASRAGPLPENALDLEDPKSMISQALKPFMRSQAQRIMDRAGGGNLGGITGIDVQDAPPRAAPGGFVNVPPTLKTDAEIKSWAKQQGYASGTRLKRADGQIGAVP